MFVVTIDLEALRATIFRHWAKHQMGAVLRYGGKVESFGKKVLGFKSQLWVTMSKLLTLSALSSLICKIVIIMLLTLSRKLSRRSNEVLYLNH